MPPKIILITGANSGIGLAAAKALTSASTNYHVIISARSLSKAQIAKAEVEAENPSSASRLSIVQLDVTDGASIKYAQVFVEKEFGHLDALINNAAIASGDPDIYTRYKVCMDTNVVGPAVIADVFRPLLLKSSNPYSIFVSSGAGSFGRAVERFSGTRDKPPEPKNGGAYHVSKAALNMLALREHHMYVDKGLKVFAFSPGFVVSNLRGTSNELRTGWGKAGPASVAGETLLSILDGKRDLDVGKLVYKDGVYDW
ncbi:related to dehydrogenases with different specificities (related to short-chain alcohol dehydrogenases) [Phialocephala subalpina]|uniref:Related to dehydrogenases with different specificities (Related to short-chain alcohol dehydrogenases) n=1 Tax=Phialocephala subalpina TaxID=576137 RepID=A0A1L7WIA5_9HELO|nr:related to dehydrogenases with different specificities (related to short-chain alcohol dehydrogenases) [Phialocephala subalpina]